MIFFNKYSPLSVFFPMGVIPVAPFLSALLGIGASLLGGSSKDKDSGSGIGGAVATGIAGAGVNYLASRSAAKGAEGAAATQAQAQRDASDTIYKQFQETKASLMPLADMTVGATEEQGKILGLEGKEAQQAAFDRYTESPGLAFAKQRGLDAVEQRYASRGALVSGAADKAVGEHIEGIQRQDFDSYFNKLGSYGNIGLSARQAIAGVGSQAAAGQANLQSAAGESIAAGQLAKGQAYQSGANNIAQGIGSIYQTWTNRDK